MANSSSKQKHFVLVHGGCHGAWCWYKLKPLLENAGHHVTALDMAASGINLTRIDEVHTLLDYSEPLIKFMESLGDDQKVILVGHSRGGLNLAVTMERFPHKIELAVFLTAVMPDTEHTPSFIFDKLVDDANSNGEFWLDCEFKSSGDPNEPHKTMLMGPKFLSKLYHLSPVEDLELAKTLVRASPMFILHGASNKTELNLSKEKYGSVKRVYVVCEKDQAMKQDFQQWMIENNKDSVVIKELKGADHMPMFSMPHELSHFLVEISDKSLLHS